MSNHFQTILDLISPDVEAIFWMTEEKLNRELKYFDEINYLFDGLISETLFDEEKKVETNLIFFTKNFGHDLKLFHLHGKDIQSGTIDELLATVKKQENKKPTIVILNSTQKKWEDELPKRYHQFQFKSL
jgi:hypothetical protein